MKIKGILYKALVCFALLIVVVIYGCTKNNKLSFPGINSFSLNGFTGIKDYSYFEQNISSDANILKFDSLIERNAFIIRSKIYWTRRNGTHTVELAQKKNKSKLDNIKKFESEADFKNALGLMGWDEESEDLLNTVKLMAQNYKAFIKNNPEFKKMAKNDRVKLLQNEVIRYHNYHNRKSVKIFRHVQEDLDDVCSRLWFLDIDDASRIHGEALAAASDFITDCMGDGITDPEAGLACALVYEMMIYDADRAYTHATSLAEDNFVYCENYYGHNYPF